MTSAGIVTEVLLKISRRTSLEYRRKGYLRYYKLDAKIFYFLNEIIEDIKKMQCTHSEI
jgi:hypothetical protein